MGISTLEALKTVVDYSTGGAAGKDLVKRRLEKAWRQGRLREEVDNPEWKFRLCCARLMNGDFSWDSWEHRHPWAQMLWFNPGEIGIPKWDGKPCKLLVLGEQGLGDEVMFASRIPEVLKTCEVEMIVEPRLVGVFERSFGVKCHPRDMGKELSTAKRLIEEKGFDAYFGLGDLPRLLGMPDGSPYLKPAPERLSEMAPYKGLTGISWRGRNGSYPLKDFPQGLSLQYAQNWDEEVETPHIDLKDDIEGVIALISVLSKVVTVSTSVAHFAGALGVETEVILAPIGSGSVENQINWRWQDGRNKKVPWYRSVTVYRNLNEWRAHRLR